MVTTVTSLGRSGLHDWILQRFSAVIMLAYVAVMGYLLVDAPAITFELWSSLFAGTFIKVFTLLALASVVIHAWIGLWIVSTDYMPKLAIRMAFQFVVMVSCLALLVWGVQVLWSI